MVIIGIVACVALLLAIVAMVRGVYNEDSIKNLDLETSFNQETALNRISDLLDRIKTLENADSTQETAQKAAASFILDLLEASLGTLRKSGKLPSARENRLKSMLTEALEGANIKEDDDIHSVTSDKSPGYHSKPTAQTGDLHEAISSGLKATETAKTGSWTPVEDQTPPGAGLRQGVR